MVCQIVITISKFNTRDYTAKLCYRCKTLHALALDALTGTCATYSETWYVNWFLVRSVWDFPYMYTKPPPHTIFKFVWGLSSGKSIHLPRSHPVRTETGHLGTFLVSYKRTVFVLKSDSLPLNIGSLSPSAQQKTLTF